MDSDISSENLQTMASIDIEAESTDNDLEVSDKLDTFPCLECGKVYKAYSSLMRHVRVKHSFGTGFSCKFCSESFASNTILADHIRNNHADNPDIIKCFICDKIFANKTSYQQHLKIHRTDRPHVCSTCGNTYKTKPDLKHHEQSHSTVRPHTCEQCGKAFIRPRDLQRHIRTHSDVKPFQCNECSKSFRTKGQLNTHSKFHTNPNEYECFICEKKFALKHALKRHLVSHRQKKQFPCSQCDKAYHFAFKLKDHVRREHDKERNFECDVCKKKFGSRENLKIHYRIHTGENPFKCSFCDKTFNQLSNKARHELTHDENKPYKCSACNKTFYKECDLKQHERIHNYPDCKPYKCPKCDKRFVSSQGLNYHISRDHNGTRYPCTLCNKSFSIVANLNQHMKSHEVSCTQPSLDGNSNPSTERENGTVVARPPLALSGKQNNTESDVENGTNSIQLMQNVEASRPQYFCSECGLSFYREENRNRHMTKVHVKTVKCELCKQGFKTQQELNAHIPECSGFTESEFFCTICEHVFSCKASFKRHMGIHIDAVPVSCTECGKVFRNEKLLKRHVIVHSENRPFQCRNCDKAFRRSDDLLKHERVHSGETPYKCRYCGKAFKQSNNCERHEQTHGTNKRFKCDECEKNFTSGYELRKHKLIHEQPDVKRFQCHLCPRKYTREKILKAHIKKAHTHPKHVCDTCASRFATLRELKKHQKSHFDESVIPQTKTSVSKRSRIRTNKRKSENLVEQHISKGRGDEGGEVQMDEENNEDHDDGKNSSRHRGYEEHVVQENGACGRHDKENLEGSISVDKSQIDSDVNKVKHGDDHQIENGELIIEVEMVEDGKDQGEMEEISEKWENDGACDEVRHVVVFMEQIENGNGDCVTSSAHGDHWGTTGNVHDKQDEIGNLEKTVDANETIDLTNGHEECVGQKYMDIRENSMMGNHVTMNGINEDCADKERQKMCGNDDASNRIAKHHCDPNHKDGGNVGKYHCQECKKIFKTEKKLWSHKAKVHNIIESSSEESDTEQIEEENKYLIKG